MTLDVRQMQVLSVLCTAYPNGVFCFEIEECFDEMGSYVEFYLALQKLRHARLIVLSSFSRGVLRYFVKPKGAVALKAVMGQHT
jgi:hypothetical protein